MASRCSATSKRTGQPCQAWAAYGTAVCRAHGAAAPQTRAAAERRRAQAYVEVLAAEIRSQDRTDEALDIYDALDDLAREVTSWKDVMAAGVERLRELTITNNFGSEEAKAWVQMYERAVDRCGRFLLDYAKLGLSAQRVRIAEAQASLIASVVQAALMAATSDPERIRQGQRVAAARLMELGHG